MPRDLPGWLEEFNRRAPGLDGTLARVLAGLLASDLTPIDLLLNVTDWLAEAETQLRLLIRDRDAADLTVIRVMISREAALRQARARS